VEAATEAEVLFNFGFAVENMKTNLIINKKTQASQLRLFLAV